MPLQSIIKQKTHEMLFQKQTIYLKYQLAPTYDVAYTQFRDDHFELPEDGATEAPKHVGAS
jgi:hypothetical protein